MKDFFMRWIWRLYEDQRGLSVVEYAVAGGFVAAVVVGAYTGLGSVVTTKIQAVVSAMG